jgi:hypothetical protein
MTNSVYEKKVLGGIMRGLVKPSDVPLTYSDMPDVGAILTACRGLESENKPITP